MTRQAVLVFGAALLLWVVGVLLDVRVCYALSAFACACEAVSLALLFNAGRYLRIERDLPRRVRQGDDIEVTLRLTSTGGVAHGSMLLRDLNPAAGEDGAPRIWLSGLGRGQQMEITYECEAAVRGEHLLEAVEVTASDPLGIFRRKRRIPCASRILVLPRWEPVGLMPLDSRQRNYLVGIERVSTEGEGQEFFGIREYRHGDSMRRVHWLSTGRAGRPMVRQFENESRSSIVLFVDTSPPAGSGDVRKQLDRAAAAAASLALHVLDSGSRVACAAASRRGDWLEMLGGEQQRQRVLLFLADLESTSAERARRVLLDTITRLEGGQALVAVISDLDAETTGIFSGLATTGRPLVLFLLEGAHGGKRRPRRGGASDGEDSEEGGRERRLQGLVGLGVPVVRVPAGVRLETAMRAWL